MADGRFGRDDFIYDRFRNEYRCLAGERLIYRFTTQAHGMTFHRYWSSNCKGCALKVKCTPSDERRVTRWEHEEVLEAVQARLDRFPEAMRIMRSTVEHPFGTLKRWMGSAHFLTRTLKRVRTEMNFAHPGLQHEVRNEYSADEGLAVSSTGRGSAHGARFSWRRWSR